MSLSVAADQNPILQNCSVSTAKIQVVARQSDSWDASGDYARKSISHDFQRSAAG